MDYNARYYSPSLGRFISPDSIVPGMPALTTNMVNDTTSESMPDSSSLNRYVYVGNNPILNTDPDGHCFPVCSVAIGAIAGGVIGASLYTINTARSGQDWNWSEAGVATLGGAVAGGLIGTGVGGVAALGLSTTTAAAVTGAGAGMAGAGAGYIGGNIVTGAEFNSVDFAITAGIGAGTGAIAPGVGTGPWSAVGLNSASNALTYEVTTYAHKGSFAFDEGLVWSGITGAAGGLIGGPATSPSRLTHHAPTDEFGRTLGKYAPDGLGWDHVKFPDQVAGDLLMEAIGTSSVIRTAGSEIVTGLNCPHEVCK